MIMNIVLIIVLLLLFAGLIKLFIINYNQLTEEEKKEIAQALKDKISRGDFFDKP